ncbi:MAG TPA: tetraacyldisaccharide 4'-kinase [Candidatus Marinimicrobia bacterium]|nr:tetraacyldisaccharide 4'-kinase [Candidatus Neomarinimicrobiota bacterium]MDP7126452.1 tetraacyldisaccharide 4'-kinase [Candidatus Neomarinimicrobiota bacterium]MEE1506629.1 tetraacyldisaccharide 4'-kinase [Candidatus Neomarinimicrobiota bacterium]MEE1573272.1 tetraacyldisaccharide 4'-kinase [Candidatus Neomarinimicrobiota bacterium]HJL77773.1 tetraacyldisaccharide 4'-kinase [Candidatus Neomarinimicrobiota bacterium]
MTLRPALSPLTIVYLGLILWRDFFYKIDVFPKRKLSCVVISIGNISSGGTGKTPMVISLAKFFKKAGKSVAVLSRGYGRQSSGSLLVTDGYSKPPNWKLCGDEPALMAMALKGIPIIVDKNRFRGGSFLIKHFNPDIILLDDGFQHFSISRNIDIVLINSGDLQQDHRLLPLGLLREPWSCTKRADIIFLTKTNLKKPSDYITRKIKQLNVPFFSSTISATSVLSSINEETISIKKLCRRRVLALSAIGDPGGFHSLIQKTGATIAGSLIYQDHHAYTKNDWKIIKETKEEIGADLILTTEKDLLKLEAFSGDVPIQAIRISLNIEDQGSQTIRDFIDKIGITNKKNRSL